MIHAHPTMKLGRRGGPSTFDGLRMATFVDRSKLPAPPLAILPSSAIPATIGAYANDKLGDCTCATWAGVFKTDAAAKGHTIEFDDTEVVRMYEVVGGYKPGDSSTDNGGQMVDAAHYAQTVGLRDTDGTLHKAGPWMQIRYEDLTEVQIALDLFGPLPVGVALPIAAQHQDVWDTDGSDGNQDPGGWGGHSLTLVAFDHDGPTFRTWGQLKRATWRWWLRYVDEAICKVDPLWCTTMDLAPAGFALEDLLAAMTVLR